MGEENGVFAGLALVAGILVGANWNKITKVTQPISCSIGNKASSIADKGMRFMAWQKEKVEDYVAAARCR